MQDANTRADEVLHEQVDELRARHTALELVLTTVIAAIELHGHVPGFISDVAQSLHMIEGHARRCNADDAIINALRRFADGVESAHKGAYDTGEETEQTGGREYGT
jgi:hypothetical protein